MRFGLTLVTSNRVCEPFCGGWGRGFCYCLAAAVVHPKRSMRRCDSAAMSYLQTEAPRSRKAIHMPMMYAECCMCYICLYVCVCVCVCVFVCVCVGGGGVGDGGVGGCNAVSCPNLSTLLKLRYLLPPAPPLGMMLQMLLPWFCFCCPTPKANSSCCPLRPRTTPFPE